MSSATVQNVYVLSPLQQGLLFHSLSAPAAGFYVDQLLLDLTGEVEVALLGRAWQAAVGRHDALRTSFHWRNLDKPLQVVHPAVALPLAVIDLRALDRGQRTERLAALCADDRRRGFDVQRAPLLRLTLVRTAAGEATLLWTYHHLLLDAWSASVLQGEVFALYQALRRGETPRLPPPRPFSDYITWLRRRDTAAAEAYWRQHLRGASGSTPFGIDLQSDRQTAQEGIAPPPDHAEVELELPATESAELVAFVRRHRLTLNTLVQGSWALLLHVYSGEPDILFGATVSGRPEEIPGVGSMVGLFINTLPVRVRVEDARPAVAWLQHLQDEQSARLTHQYSALAEIQRWSEMPAGRPLFESIVVFENVPGASASRPAATGATGAMAATGASPGGLEVRGTQYISRTNYPLILMVVPGGRLLLRATYDRHRFAPEAPGRLLGHLANLLRGFAALPAGAPLASLSPLSAAERQQLVFGWNDTAVAYPRDLTLPELFDRAVDRGLDGAQRPAFELDGRRLTYGELRQRARRLAERLRRLGVEAEEPVALCLEPSSADLVVAMLGVLEAGATYAPLDPAHPAERLAWLLDDLGHPLVIASGSTAATAENLARLGAARAVLHLDGDANDPAERRDLQARTAGIHPESLACILYTSGSTGRPKGIGVPHRAIVRLLFGGDYVSLGPDERIAQLSNVAFDAATFEIWGALLHGGCLVGIPRAVSLSPHGLAERLRRDRISTMFLTTALFNQVAREEPSAFASVRQLLFGGEAADARAVAEVLRHGPPQRLINGYGPTEGTTFTTWYRADREPAGERASLPIGLPLANSRAHLLDGEMRPVPVAVRGELYAGGDGLARGYRGRPDLTAERFLPDPLAVEPGSRLYRTGDLARRRADGAIEFIGRNDHQVKIRGFRVEPGEIEAALLAASPEVDAAAVLLAGDATGEPRLTAFVATRPHAADATGTADAGGAAPLLGAFEADLASRLRRRLAQQLPAPMVPTEIIVVATLPLTANGKVDRAALLRLPSAPSRRGGTADSTLGGPPPGAASRASAAFAARAPRTPIEELLAGIWSAVLGVEAIGPDDDFLGLGGHSLKVTQVLSRVREALGIELPLADLFAGTTLAEQAARIERELGHAHASFAAFAAAPSLVRIGRDRPLPLSFAQQRLWILDRFDPGLPAYNIPFALRLTGILAAARLEGALAALLQRHEALRTCFLLPADAAEPEQRILPLSWRLPRLDLAALPPRPRAAELDRLLTAEAARRFDLRRGPLLRSTLVRLGSDEHALLLTVHHIVADGWSLGVLFTELAALYASAPAVTLPPLAVQYADYAVWQRQWLRGDVLERQLAFWRQRLAGASSLGLPTDRPRPPLRTFRGAQVTIPFSANLAAALRERSREERATPFMLLLAAWLELQRRAAGRSDLTVGTTVANRGRLEIEGLIGFFVNTLVLRTDVGGDPTGRQLVERVREVTLAAYAHQDVPFEKLVEDLQPERSLALAPFFQVLVTLDAPPPPPRLAGLEVEALEPAGGAAKFELTLSLSFGAFGLGGGLEYNTDLFDRATARRLAAHYAALLDGLVAHPERPAAALPMLSAAESQQLLREWNDTRLPTPGGSTETLDRLVARRAALDPHRIAVLFDAEVLRYGELDRRANQLAHRLRDLGVGPEVPVGIFFDRSLAMVVAILGVLKAGGAYVPLDPAYPPERLSLTLDDCRAPVVVTQESLVDRLPPGAARAVSLDAPGAALSRWPATPPPPLSGPRNLAYLIYTSGSTGRPKGVAIEHASALALLRWAERAFDDAELAEVVAATSICFDLSVFELFVPLTRGGRVRLVKNAVDLAGLGSGDSHRITLLNTVPSAAAELARAGALPPALRTLNLAGEPIPPALAERLTAAGAMRVLNLYGPSEATTYSTWARVEPGGASAPPIGRPIAGTEAYLLDRQLQPVPIGVAGEVCIAGAGLARGYLGRPELTAASFVPHPHPHAGGGSRLYRTGDLARAFADGKMEFLGRIDQQVKVRGFRIELGEIEATLRLHPDVAEAVVTARGEPGSGDERRLIAYVVDREANHEVPAAELRATLRSRLPEHMQPAVFVALPALPMTPSGKVDRAALPDPGRARRDDSPYAEARSERERLIAGVVREVLGVDRVGIHDNFFDLGGHSLLMIRAAGLLGTRLEREVEVLELFRFPNVAALAAHFDESPAPAAPALPASFTASVASGAAVEAVAPGEAGSGRASRRELRRQIAGVRPSPPAAAVAVAVLAGVSGRDQEDA